MDHALRVIFERTDGSEAVLRLEDGREVRWPLASLPRGLAERGEARLRLSTDGADADARDALAATVLSELLRDGSRP